MPSVAGSLSRIVPRPMVHRKSGDKFIPTAPRKGTLPSRLSSSRFTAPTSRERREHRSKKSGSGIRPLRRMPLLPFRQENAPGEKQKKESGPE